MIWVWVLWKDIRRGRRISPSYIGNTSENAQKIYNYQKIEMGEKFLLGKSKRREI